MDNMVVPEVEKLEKFVRKVARISLIDIEIACGQGWPEGGHFSRTGMEMREKLQGLVKKAKVLTGMVKKPKE
jgi:hypothetical protein